MKEKLFILIILFSFQTAVLIAQCPPADSARKEYIDKKSSSANSNMAKLSILLGYRDMMVKCSFKKDSTYAWLIKEIGWAYFDEDNPLEAINYFLSYIDFYKPGVTDNIVNPKAVINLYYFLSRLYDGLNNEMAKRKAIDSCIIISERLNDPYNPSCLRCLSDRQQYFYDIGEYKLCINDAEKCENGAREYLKTATQKGEIDLAENAIRNSFHWHINALISLYQFSEAEKLLANKAVEYKKSGPKNYLALTYTQWATVLEAEGKYEESLVDLNLAYKLYRENKDSFSCKQTLNKIGQEIYFNHFNDYDKALFCFKNALKFINHNISWNREDSIESLSIYGHIANVYVQKGLSDSAFFYFKIAMSHVKKDADINDILNSTQDEFARIKKIDYLSDLLVNYGNAYRKKYEVTKQGKELAEAINVYSKVDKLLARINISQFEQESKLSWRKDARRLYENAIEACYLAKDADKAFYFFERSRSALLNIQLNEQNWLGHSDIAKSDELKSRITELNNSINKLPGNSNGRKALGDSLRARKDDLYNLQQLIKTRYPLYYQNMDTSVLALKDVRKGLLNDHQAILEIFSGDSFTYSLLITDNNAVINKVDKADFERTAGLYTSYISNHNLLNKDFPGFRKTAHHLYELILQNNPVPEGRIIISPEGYYFPFESLIADNNEPDPVYFILNHAVSYTYSVRYLFNNFGSPVNVPAGNFLGFAPVIYSPGFQLSGLTGSDLSLKNIGSAIYNTHFLVAQNASRNNFRQQFMNYKIVQLYTHASDSSDRKEPVIYFNDSALYLSELLPEGKPVTELIVLSACETGNGQLYQGEGVFSFNRGFAALGIPSSISNLWSIDSKSTYTLNELFYKFLAKGLPLDVALQKAKLEYMDNDAGENQLPYYWAAPVLVGKTDTIILDKPFQWQYIFTGIAMAGVCFLAWRVSRRKKIAIIPIRGTTETAS